MSVLSWVLMLQINRGQSCNFRAAVRILAICIEYVEYTATGGRASLSWLVRQTDGYWSILSANLRVLCCYGSEISGPYVTAPHNLQSERLLGIA